MDDYKKAFNRLKRDIRAKHRDGNHTVELFKDGDIDIVRNDAIGNAYCSRGILVGIPRSNSKKAALDAVRHIMDMMDVI